jgi:endonuclease G
MPDRSSKNRKDNNLVSKLVLFAVALVGAFVGFQKCGGFDTPGADTQTTAHQPVQTEIPTGLPRGGSGELVQHRYLSLSYREDHEQAEWVAHEISRENLNQDQLEREDNFRPDPKVKTGSAAPNDYRSSGYDRGHLCPNGDLSFDKTAQQETFYMSNMSPQVRTFNGGIWRELEENVRDWARKHEHLYIVTGPVLTKRPLGTIGEENEISVPVSYYKVVLTTKGKTVAGIGFVIANDLSDIPLTDFAVSIDEVERITGLDFYAGLLDADQEKTVERTFDPKLWPIRSDRYERRITEWNKR